MQINRLFEMVYLLLYKKRTTAKELAEHFEVSVRTILRDIETLSSAGIPIYTLQGKGGGISILDNFVLNKAAISEEEQIKFYSLCKVCHPQIILMLAIYFQGSQSFLKKQVQVGLKLIFRPGPIASLTK